MTLRTRLFLVISLAVLLVLGISIALLVLGKKKPTAPAQTFENAPFNVIQQNSPTGQPGSVPSGQTAPAVPKLTAEETEKNAVRQIAKIFVERYNSFSTDNNWQNVVEVKALVTSDMWKKISGRIGTKVTGSFVGQTTEVLVNNLAEFSPPLARCEMQTRVTLEKNGVATMENKNIFVHLTKKTGEWLVDSYEWQK